MDKPLAGAGVAPDLLAGWVRARSFVRGLPQPVSERGGLRVDTGLPDERRRHVFAGPAPGIAELAREIDAPHIPIKMCGPAEQLLALVPPRWQLQPGCWLMTQDGAPHAAAPLPAGYRLEVLVTFPSAVARIFAADGTLAARGHAAQYAGVFIFDRIRTVDGHQRRGLGRALMAALGATQRPGAARRVLVATGEGRALYETLGWTVLAPYSTVVIGA